MSELCSPKPHFSRHIIPNFVVLCSFVLSNPLYFSYFIFFSPYAVKLISFLSPLFITTILLFLSFLTGVPHDSTGLAHCSLTHLLIPYASALAKLSSGKVYEDEELRRLEDFEMYHVLFGSFVEAKANPVEILEENSDENPLRAPESSSDSGDLSVSKCEASTTTGACNSEEIFSSPGSNLDDQIEGKRLENFLKILDQFERMSSNGNEKKEMGRRACSKNDKVVEKQRECPLVRNGSEEKSERIISFSTGAEECISMVSDYTDASDGDHALKTPSSGSFDHSLGSYGSMRKEREWKRTLACKLFEERHRVGGGEGMDSLWEAYEMDSDKSKPKKDRKKTKTKTKSEIEIEEEEEEEVDDGHLCCLQAIKMSSRKMNFGMGRPNLAKISKAVKGIGWLRHVGKNCKKVHNNGDRFY